MQNTRNRRMRELLSKKEIIVATGAFNAFTAKMIEQAGFPVVYVTGYGASADLLGAPDYGLLTLTEMANHCERIAQAVNIPVIADGDTGYGNAINVRRMIRAYERAGVSAVHIEDQVTPKRCGHMEGKEVISAKEYIKKIEAAVDARTDPDFVIIARTDARAVHGLDEAIRRVQMALEAGADVGFVEAPQSVEELKKIAGSINAPVLVGMIENGKTPLLTAKQLQDLGFKIVVFPLSTLYAAAYAVRRLVSTLKADGITTARMEEMLTFHEFNTFIGLPEYQALEKKYAVSE
ncbi:MAG TPA: isocitrate lyase/PEP mutase family protein [Firmicutes bacterium]|nr:isocitrate lyase/PEP mutase family protein [Candidatus Fermentithermobacillaceae bacterium]